MHGLFSQRWSLAHLVYALWFFLPVVGAAQVTNFPPSYNLVKLLTDSSRPIVYALDASTLSTRGQVLALNATNGAAQSILLVGTNPTDMVLSPAGDALYVINAGSRSVSKIQTATFQLVGERAITTPNTYDPNNPLHLGVKAANLIYYTDGAWEPAIYSLNFDTGLTQLVHDPNYDYYGSPIGVWVHNGTGGFVVTRDGNTVFTWLQSGWSAGWANSTITRFALNSGSFVPLEYSPEQGRGTFETPILLNQSETLVFNKYYCVAATNVSVLKQTFSENIYAITSDGTIALGNTKLFKTVDGVEVTNFPFSSTVQALSPTDKKLFRYNTSNRFLVVYDMAVVGNPSAVTNPVPADTAVVNLPQQLLTWNSSKAALRYNVYLGTNATAVMSATTNSPLWLGTTEATNVPLITVFSPGTTYYWRVDAMGLSSITAGALWSFSASPVIVGPQPLRIRALVGLPILSQELTLDGISGMDWNLVIAHPWMTASATNGTTPGTAILHFGMTNLSAGIYTNLVTISSSNVVLEYPVIVSLANLNASQMVADRNRNFIYVLHPGSTMTNDAFVLFLNTMSGIVEKVIPIGINPTDMTVNAHENRLYISNWKSDKTRVVDLVNQVELPPLSMGTQINRINAGRAGRVVTEGEGLGFTNPLNPQSIYNTANGAQLFTRQWNGGDGECESTGTYYYYGFPNPHLIYKYNISADNFVEVKSAAANNFVTSGVLVSPDDSRVIFCGNVYDANLNLLTGVDTGIHACNSNATIVFGSSQAYAPGFTTQIHNLPVTTSVLAVDRTDEKVWYFDSSTKRVESLALSLVRAPKIVKQPTTNTVVVTGANAQLNPTVLGMPPLAFQWTFGGTNLSGATNVSLTISNISPSSEGDYQLMASSPYGAVTSTVAHITVLVPPAITMQPLGTNVSAGQSFSLASAANGTPSPTNRWTFEGVIISGATNSTLIITNAQSTNEGIYRLIAQNSAGSVTSAVALVRVFPATPTFSINPVTQTIGASSNVLFMSFAIGSQPLSYRWYFNGNPVALATNSSLSLSNVQAGNAGTYYAVVTNKLGAATSTVAILTISPTAPYFVTQPLGATLSAGTNFALASLARGSEPITYQWRLNGTNLASANQSSLSLTNLSVNDAADYSVAASNAVDVTISAVATLTVTSAAPAFIQQPISVTASAGASTNFTSLASGSPPPRYQWYFQGNPMLNQSNRVFSFAPVALAAAGSYYVTASNSVSTATSSVVQLTVNQLPVLLQGLTNQVVALGATVTLSVSATGSVAPVFSWRFNGTLVSTNATNSFLTISNIQPAQSGYYRVTLTNQFGSVSSTCRVSVMGAPLSIIAWGDNSGGQTNAPDSLEDLVAIAGGDYHSLALRQNGTLLAWGANFAGQTNTPTNALRFVAIASGTDHNLAVTEAGNVVAWGQNDSGQTNVPATATSVLAIAGGDAHSVALLPAGTVVCWGGNSFGQVSGASGLTSIKAIVAGRNHNLALRTNGTVAAWGYNAYRQASPPSLLANVTGIAAGYLHSAALLSNGTVVVWGDNSFGQTNVPVGLSNVVAIAAGDFHTYALRGNGQIVAWGDNLWGQLAVPSTGANAAVIASGNYHGLVLLPAISMLNSTLKESNLIIEWNRSGVLQWAPTPTGPFTDLPTVDRSYTNTDFTDPAKFFRLRR